MYICVCGHVIVLKDINRPININLGSYACIYFSSELNDLGSSYFYKDHPSPQPFCKPQYYGHWNKTLITDMFH